MSLLKSSLIIISCLVAILVWTSWETISVRIVDISQTTKSSPPAEVQEKKKNSERHVEASNLEFIYIISRQRSGSTSLTSSLSHMVSPCSIMMNEMFNGNMKVQHAMLGNKKLFREWQREADDLSALGYLQDQRSIYCKREVKDLGASRWGSLPIKDEEKSMTLEEFCHLKELPCIGVVKIFDDPGWGQTNPNSKLYQPFAEMITYDRALSLILQRSAAEQECSLRWAKKSGDWSTGAGHHLKNKTKQEEQKQFYANCPDKASPQFQAKNDLWFRTVKNIHEEKGKPYIKVAFNLHKNKDVEKRLTKQRVLDLTQLPKATTDFQAQNDLWFDIVKNIHEEKGKAYINVPFKLQKIKHVEK